MQTSEAQHQALEPQVSKIPWPSLLWNECAGALQPQVLERGESRHSWEGVTQTLQPLPSWQIRETSPAWREEVDQEASQARQQENQEGCQESQESLEEGWSQSKEGGETKVQEGEEGEPTLAQEVEEVRQEVQARRSQGCASPSPAPWPPLPTWHKTGGFAQFRHWGLWPHGLQAPLSLQEHLPLQTRLPQEPRLSRIHLGPQGWGP